MMKRVLLPTDFSQNSNNAISYALELYKHVQCTFYLLHTYSIPVYNSEYHMINPHELGLGEFYLKEARSRLNTLKEAFEKSHPNQNHGFVIHGAFNTLEDEVLQMVTKKGIHVVVMGTKGATGAKELLFGSHTVHLFKKARCPILAVPEGCVYETPQEILFPTDYEVGYTVGVIGELLFLAKEHMGRINVLHVSAGYGLTDAQIDKRAQLAKLLHSFSHRFQEAPTNEVIKGINDFQLKHKVNLLVMLMNKHNFLERLFIKPVIRKIGLHLDIPFMVIPYPHRTRS